jgi:hypothetical protein
MQSHFTGLTGLTNSADFTGFPPPIPAIVRMLQALRKPKATRASKIVGEVRERSRHCDPHGMSPRPEACNPAQAADGGALQNGPVLVRNVRFTAKLDADFASVLRTPGLMRAP